ncbi:hypothetical protein FQ087_20875 [Sporosarcina sp. ANT_H38]|uniref:phage scaffolding protein n=1 Tax=Sporosarcina sp. ANT_H38 TaxID=2597358 RepID=UPI0011F24DAC|nr:phage scaffolding protein [Sporosarcina sp. ANT_H38]KAA0941613.1 hypothetical protein FQ087_20875 [Sporosarcina sp. ANT_H38]
MNREALKALGLTDEQVDSVMASHGSVVNATKGELTAMTTERDDLKGQLTDRDTQLNDLSGKAKDNEELSAEIDRLKGENATATTELQEKLDKQAFDFTLEKALTGAKVRNPKAVKALLDTDSIKLDGDKLLNLDSQLDTLKASDAYLFEVEEVPPNSPAIVTPGNPNGGQGTAETDPFAAKLAKYE